MRRVEHDLASIRYCRLNLVHGFGRRPEILVDRRWHRQHAAKSMWHPNDLQRCREIRRCTPGLDVTAAPEAVELVITDDERYANQWLCEQLGGAIDDAPDGGVLDSDRRHARGERTEPVRHANHNRSRYAGTTYLAPPENPATSCG